MIIDMTNVTKEIHFPIARAIYKKPPKRKWYQKIFKFLVYRRWSEVMVNYILWVPLLNAFILIPKRFLSDGASVPKVLNSLFNTNGMLLLGAWPHDFGYRYECLLVLDSLTGEVKVVSFPKKELDTIFESLCAWESGFNNASKVAKAGLSVGGFVGWNENRKEGHILYEDFPELLA